MPDRTAFHVSPLTGPSTAEHLTAGRTDSRVSGMKDNGLPDQRIPEEVLQHTFPPARVTPGKDRGDHSLSLLIIKQGRGAP